MAKVEYPENLHEEVTVMVVPETEEVAAGPPTTDWVKSPAPAPAMVTVN
jgi:hypothetical protein